MSCKVNWQVSAYILTPPKWHGPGAGRLPTTPVPMCKRSQFLAALLFFTSLPVLCSFQVLSLTWEFPKPSPGLRLSHSLRACSYSSFLIVSIDLGKSINVAFFQFVCLSLASGSFFSSVGSITFLSLEAVWHALLEHRSRAIAMIVWIRRAPPAQGGPAEGILGNNAEMHSHGLIFI